jgi:alpha-glucosidase (family GH31 glycosyl hydrolase)
MLGDALLVHPVLTPDTTWREAYLPNDGIWYNFETGDRITLDNTNSTSIFARIDHMIPIS